MNDCTNPTESNIATAEESDSILPSWERRHDLGFVTAFRSSCDEICYDADRTFQAMPREGGISGPLLFAFLGNVAVLGYLFLACASVGLLQFYLANTEQITQTEFVLFYFAIVARAAFLGLIFPVASIGWIGITSLVVFIFVRFDKKTSLQFTVIFRAFCYAMGEALYLQRWMLPVMTIVICAFWFALFCLSLAFSSEMFSLKDIPSVILFSSLIVLFISSVGSLSQYHQTNVKAILAITGYPIAQWKLDFGSIAMAMTLFAWMWFYGMFGFVLFGGLIALYFWKPIYNYIRLHLIKAKES